jgi:triosephosphate isomerase (TIM)
LSGPRRLVAGNWKMNGASNALKEARALADALAGEPASCRVALFPPAPLIHRMAEAVDGGVVEIGAQDCHAEPEGAYTGDLSAEMLHDAGATLVILGHSERRTGYRESDADVAAKVEAALRAGLEPVICVGESLEERDAGRAIEVVSAQVRASLPSSLEARAFAVAYEPVWAIGSGRTPTVAQVEEVHGAIHALLSQRFSHGGAVPVLYGGSVKPSNAAELMSAAGVDGALVGGASLRAADFLPIVRAS